MQRVGVLLVLVFFSGCKPPDPWFWRTPVRCSAEAEPEGASAERRGRSACEIREEFRAYVAQRQSCTTSAQCTIQETSNPFGCSVPVRRASVTEVQAKHRELYREYSGSSEGVVFKDACIPALGVECLQGYCVRSEDLKPARTDLGELKQREVERE